MTFGLPGNASLGAGRSLRGMLNSVSDAKSGVEKMLLLDTCGEGAGVALSAGETLLANEPLPRGGGSAEIVSAVQRVLEKASIKLSELDAIGVVSGPGSFTGVRVGMAAAKGLAEAAGVRMIATSRLKVLAKAASATDSLAVLDAGRGECYVMESHDGSHGDERLSSIEEIAEKARGREIVVAEEKLQAKLVEIAPDLRVRKRALQVKDALLPLLQMYRQQGGTMVLEDANYLRRESDIYGKNAAGDA